jgi:hypothetical protein
MNKRETFKLLEKITVFYDQFIISQEKVNLWHQILQNYPVDTVEESLISFVTESSYPPKISDLIPKPAHSKVIPSQEETKEIITRKTKIARESVVQTELAKMRAILGIVR